MVLDHFDQIQEMIKGKVIYQAMCKHYSLCLTCASSGGTRHLHRHITDYCKKKISHKMRKPQQIVFIKLWSVGLNASTLKGLSDFEHMGKVFTFTRS